MKKILAMKNKLAQALCIISFSCFASPVSAQIIYRVAGSDTCGYNDGPAFHASFRQLEAICRDDSGNLYMSDLNNMKIRKLNAATGIVTTIGGNPSNIADTIDNIPATSAYFLYGIGGMCLDANGNLLLADRQARIRKIDFTTGMITTAIGTYTIGYSGDGGLATAALLNGPMGITMDHAGNIYIAQAGHNAIRKVSASTGIITTIAGGNPVGGFGGDGGQATAALLNNPVSVFVEPSGNILVSDYLNSRIRKINVTTGIITTVAGNGSIIYSGDGGPATAAGIDGQPRAAIEDSHGNIYIEETSLRVRRVDAVTGIITTYAGNALGVLPGTVDSVGDGGPATATGLYIGAICFDTCDNLFLAGNSCRIRVVTKNQPVNGRLCGLLVSSVEGPANVFKEETLKIWPNPNYGTFTLRLSSNIDGQARVVVTDVIGREVKQFHCITNKDSEVYLDAGPGLYFVIVDLEEGRYSQKVMVAR